MKFAATALLVLAISCSTAQTVDPALVGTWEMTVPNEAGAALWVWEVRANGTYDFHAEGPGNVPSHHGTFQAANGKYVLNAANLDWHDTGTYDPPAYTIVRMTSNRLGTGYWTRKAMAVQSPSKSSKESDSVDDMIKGLDQNGIGEDAELGHYDAAAAARTKARNQGKIEIYQGIAAVIAAMGSKKKPVVLFYSGGMNIDSLIYSDAMVALAGRAEFGLDADKEPDILMTDAPQKTALQEHVYPRILIVKPRFTVDQFTNIVAQMRPKPGETVKAPPMVEFEWEYLGAKPAKEWASMIDAELRKLGY